MGDARSSTVRPSGLHSVIALIVGVVGPVLVTLVVPRDLDRLLIPAAVMLACVVASGLLGRFVEALVSAAVSAALLLYYYLPPRHSLRVADAENAVAVVVFVATALLLTAVVETLERRAAREARARAEAEVVADAHRAAAQALQTALLPARIPLVPGVDVAARYLAAADIQVGGDWYSVVPLPGDRLGVAIGDVAGHGLGAITTMAEVRFALRALAAQDAPPQVVLDALNRLIFAFGGEQVTMVTALYGVLDVPRQVWVQSVAGHLPVMVADKRGTVRMLREPLGVPLGVDRGARYRAVEFEIERGSTLLLYTDGLVERRREPLDHGLARLSEALTGESDARDPEHVCDRVIDRLGATHAGDDVAVVAVHLQ